MWKRRSNGALKVGNQRCCQAALAAPRELQQRLLPSTRLPGPALEVVCHSTQAHEFGGDFYTYHACASDQIVLAAAEL